MQYIAYRLLPYVTVSGHFKPPSQRRHCLPFVVWINLKIPVTTNKNIIPFAVVDAAVYDSLYTPCVFCINASVICLAARIYVNKINVFPLLALQQEQEQLQELLLLIIITIIIIIIIIIIIV